METTTITTSNNSPARAVAINALAVVGFIVLIIIGMAFAVYAASFVPKAVSRLNGAAVYLSSIFVPADKAGIEVVAPGTTVPFAEAPGAGIASTTATTTTPVATTPATTGTPAAGTPGYHVYPTGGTTDTNPVLTGLPDLKVDITATGYLTSSNTSTFVKSDTVPDNMRGAVKFTITNVGTNSSGRFTFEAPLPTSKTYTFSSESQDSLLPGEHIDYVLGFDRAKSGSSRMITITVDQDGKIKEVSESNNSDSATVTIK